MKNIMVICLALFMFGCTYEGSSLQGYIDDPRTIVKDPHFAGYKEKRDHLESQYLNKEITYADYVAAVDELDQTYNKEVQERNSKTVRSDDN